MNNIGQYSPITAIQVAKNQDGVQKFTQNVEAKGQTFKVTLTYHTDREVHPDKVKTDMEARIDKVIYLATELGLGTEAGLEKIKVSQSEVKGYWNNETEKPVCANFREKLVNDKKSEGISENQIDTIDHKISVIDSMITAFQFIQKPKVPSAPKTSTEQISLTVQSPIARSEGSKLISQNFAVTTNEVKNLVSQLSILEGQKRQAILNINTQLYANLNDLDGVSPAVLRQELQNASLDTKQFYDKAQNEIFDLLEQELITLTEDYNNVVELKNGTNDENLIREYKGLEAEMGSTILETNLLIGRAGLPTNQATVIKSQVIDYSAVVEKKLALLEKKEILEAILPNERTSAQEKKLTKINNELKKAPTLEKMLISNQFIVESQIEATSLDINGKILSSDQAKKLNQPIKELAWGKTHLSKALTNPSNWGEVRTVMIKFSKAGKMHVTAMINTPLNIGPEGGVPAGLRSHKKFEHRATNLIMTTSYLVNRGGFYGVNKTFRGGQFPTKDAAYEALTTIFPLGEKLNSLHINALLTPLALTSIKKDKLLLETHKKSILAAIDQMALNGYDLDEVQKLRDTVAISNFGVNEGAVGEAKVLFMPLKLGWHTSIDLYSNEACQRLNTEIKNWLDVNAAEISLSQVDRLGAILQVGQEMEAIWANNDYATASVGNNQFKMAALWKVMDCLLGVTIYTDCMSGKDRTGEVESNAQEYLDEINMNIADQSKANEQIVYKLSETLSDDENTVWLENIDKLISASFTEGDLEQLLNALKESDDLSTFPDLVDNKINEKIQLVKDGLGGNNGLFEEKGGIPKGFLNWGTNNIPSNPPKINLETNKEIQKAFPGVATSSMYNRDRINILNPTKDEIAILENRQREANNRGISQLSGSLQITQMNTGKPGFKVEGGEPFAIYSSGFDRDYVLYRLTHITHMNDLSDQITLLTGLNTFDKKTQDGFQNDLLAVIQNGNMHMDKKIDAFTKTLKEIENAKMKNMMPKAKVAA